jgi:hypothetical protein
MWVTALAVVAFSSTGALAGDVAALRAKVPFDFNVGDKVLPAGEYQFSKSWSPRAIQISSRESKAAVTVLHSTGGRNATGLPDALVFNKYGNRYFLREIWIAGEDSGAQLPRSRTEREQVILVRNPVREVLVASALR